ncbi:MAG: ABC transporter permease [Dehalococcoidia bacterium]|nr:ABC transporter permease [Dehalococcoidia bacterium]
MQRLIAMRVFYGFITLIIVSMLVFILSRLTGDPTSLMLPLDATEEARENMRHVLGLDRPLPEQYWIFVSNAVRGDLGKSIRFREQVSALYMQRLPNTLKLAGCAVLFVLVVSIPLGCLSALKKDSAFDVGVRTVVSMGLAAPSFWLGLMLMQIFAVWLRWVDAAGMAKPTSYILPAVTLGMHMASGITRILRSGMIDVLDSEFIKMLRIKGLPERQVVFRHGLKNAFIPPLTILGQYTAIILGGAVVVEVIFTWPGIGRLSYEAIMSRDFPVIQAVVLINGAILLFANLLVDILYAYVDPRIRSSV